LQEAARFVRMETISQKITIKMKLSTGIMFAGSNPILDGMLAATSKTEHEKLSKLLDRVKRLRVEAEKIEAAAARLGVSI